MIVTLIYLAVALLCIYPFYMVVLREFMVGDGDAADHGFAGFFGVLAAAFWPLILVGYAAFRLSRLVWDATIGKDETRKEHV